MVQLILIFLKTSQRRYLYKMKKKKKNKIIYVPIGADMIINTEKNSFDECVEKLIGGLKI